MSGTDTPVQDFQGRVALVTGAGSGMGAATARELAGRGARVFAVDRNGDALAQLADELPEVFCLVGDVSEPDFCAEAITAAVDRGGGLDVLVNAAGIILRADAPGTADDDWKRMFDVNVGGVFYLSRAAVKVMKDRGHGVIVNFGSIWGDVGAAGVLAYCASKGAVHQITRAMALDHADDGIRINAVAPGEVNTPMLASGRVSMPSKADLDELADRTIPLRRLAEPIEIARVVAFLASDAASYMTGAIVPVDAGYTAR